MVSALRAACESFVLLHIGVGHGHTAADKVAFLGLENEGKMPRFGDFESNDYYSSRLMCVQASLLRSCTALYCT